MKYKEYPKEFKKVFKALTKPLENDAMILNKARKFNYKDLKKLDRIEYLLRSNNLDYHSYTVPFLYGYFLLGLIILMFVLLIVSAFNIQTGVDFFERIMVYFRLFKPLLIGFLILDVCYNLYIYDKRLKLKQEMMLQ